MRGSRGWALAAAIALSGGADARADVRVFEPTPRSQPQFAVAAPQTAKVPGGAGETVHVDTWLPAAKDGNVPPARLPSVLLYSPYEKPGAVAASSAPVRDALVARGYAFSVAHIVGSGGSTGCQLLGGRAEQAAGARVVEYLGENAPWASGHVGMIGTSASGGSALNVAASAERDKVATLDAIIPSAPTGSQYDFFHHDGVPHLLQAGASTTYDAVNNGFVTGRPGLEADPLSRLPCQPGEIGRKTASLGDYDRSYEESDRHLDVGSITAATLMTHGHADMRVSSLTQAGLFDRLPASTPRAGLFSRRSHSTPLLEQRPDFLPMVVAWFDRWLKGLDAGTGAWPVAQVESSAGTWRAFGEWPFTRGVPGQLALGAGGVLGTGSPTGRTSYLESAIDVRRAGYRYPPGTAAVFETSPLSAPLELVGVPVLDAWVRLDRPDAHIAVKLEAIGAHGEITAADATTIGARSAQHLQRMPDDHFTQAKARPAKVGAPLRVPVRLNPTDLAVPEGGRLRLTIAGSVIGYDGLEGAQKGMGEPFFGPTMPSGAATNVTVLHDCAHPTVLRFETPNPRADVLAVAGRPAAPVAPADAGGAVRERVCDKRPRRPRRSIR